MIFCHCPSARLKVVHATVYSGTQYTQFTYFTMSDYIIFFASLFELTHPFLWTDITYIKVSNHLWPDVLFGVIWLDNQVENMTHFRKQCQLISLKTIPFIAYVMLHVDTIDCKVLWYISYMGSMYQQYRSYRSSVSVQPWWGTRWDKSKFLR